MGLRYRYTMSSGAGPIPVVVTSHAESEAAARAAVEKLLTDNQTLALGIIRDLGDRHAPVQRCKRSDAPGRFAWRPLSPSAAPVWA